MSENNSNDANNSKCIICDATSTKLICDECKSILRDYIDQIKYSREISKKYNFDKIFDAWGINKDIWKI